MEDEIIRVSSNRLNKQAINHVEDVCLLFLKMFDMIPLVDDQSSDEEKEKYILARKYLALALRYDLSHGLQTLDFFRYGRKKIMEENPAMLQF